MDMQQHGQSRSISEDGTVHQRGDSESDRGFFFLAKGELGEMEKRMR